MPIKRDIELMRRDLQDRVYWEMADMARIIANKKIDNITQNFELVAAVERNIRWELEMPRYFRINVTGRGEL